jgi:putative heme-binding domain-containing protein
MRLLADTTRPVRRRSSAVAFCSALAIAVGAHGVEPPAPTGRLPWTTSQLRGTPDPPPPYAVEQAFPKLVFDRPVLLDQAPGTRYLVVAELGGKVLSFPADPAADRAEIALDLNGRGERVGPLYGLAFHPRFEANRQVFVCYTLRGDRTDGTRVSRFVALGVDPLRIDPASEEVVLTFPSGGHNGGCLAFGNDGFLYISTGDAASPAPPDPLDTGQDISDLLSSILRVDVDHRDPGHAYRVPPDNPFVHLAGARPEVWAYGFRNPWRMSFDRATGDLWVGDVGWEQWELIFRVERGGNYGWSVREGRQPVRPASRVGPTPISPPTVDHPHSEAASITGGYVARGGRLADLAGTYVYGDYQSGKVWGLKFDGRRVTWHGLLADTGLRLVAFGEDQAGELYLLEHERTNQVYRLVTNRAEAGAGHAFPRTLSKTGLFASTGDQTPAAGVVRYRINAEMWADGARAERFLAIPGLGQVEIDRAGFWKLPEESVLARTVTVDVWEAGAPAPRPRPIETQILHRENGSWRPYTYIWGDDEADATLADAAGASRMLAVADPAAPQQRATRVHRVAARAECVLCHNPWIEAQTTVFGVQSASPLAVSIDQLDCAGPATDENQLRRLERLGYFARPLPWREGRSRTLVDPYDAGGDFDARARSYLQVNCAHCHSQHAGGTALIALGAGLALGRTGTVGAPPVQGSFGIDDARIIAPGVPEQSVLYYRIAKMGAGRMPRIGSQEVDARGVRLIADWIARLAGADGSTYKPEKPPADADAVRRMTGSTREALALVRLIDRGSVPPPVVRTIVEETKSHPRPEIRDLFERFVRTSERVARLGDTIDPGLILGLNGDADRGREWFFAESATQCKSCHRIGGQGIELGPDLDAIGSKYGKPELLAQILEPARTVEPKYAVHVIETKDGRVHQGLLVEQSPGLMVVRDAQNRSTPIATGDIERRATQATSLMPDGLLRDLTAQQAADLLEYLSTLKGR